MFAMPATSIFAISWGQTLLALVFVSVCLLLILIVMLQKGRGEGLAGAFGGTSGSAFGAKTGDVFTWVTVGLFVAYLLLAVTTNYAFVPNQGTPPPAPVLTAPATPESIPVTTPDSTPPATPIKINVDPDSTSETPIKINLDPQSIETIPAPDAPADTTTEGGTDAAAPAEDAGKQDPPAEQAAEDEDPDRGR